MRCWPSCFRWSPPRRRRPTRSCSSATATSGSRRPTGRPSGQLTSGGGYASPSMADDGTIVALRGGMFVRLRPDGAAVGAPIARGRPATGSCAAGPYDARVSPDGAQDRLLVHRPARSSACRSSRAARCRTPTSPPTPTPTARPTRSSSARCASAASRRGTARAARSCSATARDRRGGGDQPRRPRRVRQPGLVLLRRRHRARPGPARPRRRPARGRRGRQGDPPVRRRRAAARAAGLRCVVPGRPVRRPDVVARRHDARVGGGRRRPRRRAGARPARRRCPTAR